MRLILLRWLASFFALALATSGLGQAAAPSLSGFAEGSAARQRSTESRFDSLLRKENLRDWMSRFASRPHHLGSAQGKATAEALASMFRSWGYETAIEEFQVLFPTPKTREIELLEPRPFAAMLAEPPLREDRTSSLTDEQLPLYNAYSADGNVTAELVYVNYGVPADYEVLEEHGVDVRGKLVIARYGGSWRGIKPKVAAEHGAVGCILYSDPRDDGFFQGEVYPRGSFRNEMGAQRGSVADMPLYPGDPLTPGVGSTAGARRLALADARTLTKIPVLPISYADAQPLLEALAGPVAPPAWRGALPITYHIGPGPAKVRLSLASDWRTVTAYDVIARLGGAERPEEWIVRGNHHDAWVFGADDPVSGLVAMLEEARAIGELARSGWRPKRTIVYAAWDGEEPGLLGSTEWAEEHAEELTAHAAVYINSDSNGRGFLYAGGSHLLERFVGEVALDVTDPQKNIPVASRLRARRIVDATTDEERKEIRENEPRISALGSGSDYTVFLDHLGIPSLSIGFGGEDDNGIYHSIYDSIDYYTRFGDPSFDYGIALAKTTGRMVLRLAGSDLLPFRFTNLADTVGRYGDELAKLLSDMRKETEERNRQISESTLDAVADSTKPRAALRLREEVPHLNFAPLQNAIGRLKRSARAADEANAKMSRAAVRPETARAIDAAMMRVERAMLGDGDGLPGRPWFRHQLYAPGFYTGYGVKTLPAIREAIEQRSWKDADEQIARVSRTVDAVSGEIDRVTVMMK